MRYEDVSPTTRQELRDALASDSAERAARAILATALYDTDWRWAEQQCLSALQDKRQEVRAAAIVGLGHVARVHGKSTLTVVIPALEALGSSKDFAGIVEDAIEDILLFTQANNART